MSGIKLTGAWKELGRMLAKAPARAEAAFRKALLQEAQFLRTQIVDGIRAQAPGGRAFAPLAPSTLAIRKLLGFSGTKALLVRGDLRNSITVSSDDEQAFVGILRTAKTADGRALADVAALNEHGSRPIVVRLTPKMRALLHVAFRRAGIARTPGHAPGIGIAVIQIPPRPMFQPVFEKYAQPAALKQRFAERVATLLRGDFGRP